MRRAIIVLDRIGATSTDGRLWNDKVINAIAVISRIVHIIAAVPSLSILCFAFFCALATVLSDPVEFGPPAASLRRRANEFVVALGSVDDISGTDFLLDARVRLRVVDLCIVTAVR